MKQSIFISIAFLTLMFNGCNQGPTITSQITDPHVLVENSSLYGWLNLETINYVKRSDEMLEFEASFRNISEWNRVLAYRIDWYDENGFSIKTILSKWTVVEVEQRRNLIIHGISPTNKTTNFKIRLQVPTSDDDLRKNNYHYEYQGK